MAASFMGQAPVVEALLSRGAEIEARDDGGLTALMLASTDIAVETLLDHGAEIEARADDGQTALIWASLMAMPQS